MNEATFFTTMADGQAVVFPCRDGVMLRGHLWHAPRGRPAGCVVINPATGVIARYYHRYARFLASHGFDVLTYDYRGIGASRPPSLHGRGGRADPRHRPLRR